MDIEVRLDRVSYSDGRSLGNTLVVMEPILSSVNIPRYY